MTDLVERVARALCQNAGFLPDAVSNDEDETPHWTLYASDARVAIEAMREPTEAMVAAGSGVTWWDGKDDEEWEENVSTDTAKRIYQAMIDEALK